MTEVWSPDGATSRGTAVVLPGRGEHPGVYQRLGRRLAVDGYTVVVADLGTGGAPGGVPDAAAALALDAAAVTALLGEHGGASRVLLGVDSGALLAWRLAVGGEVALDALVLAGLPLTPATAAVPTRRAELAARTACPVHQALLTGDRSFRWGELGTEVSPPPAALADLPTLILHGEDDRIAPVDPVRELAARHPAADLAVVVDGVHDVLNDQFHRSVAARLVLFLERVGKGAVIRDQVGDGAPTREDSAVEPARPVRARRAAPLHVSARLDYALRAVAELITAGGGDLPVRCEAISHARGIPLNSLVNLMVELRRAGLVRSQRGCEGGYWLARPSSAITVADVVRAVEGEVVSLHADGPNSWLWHQLGRTVATFLEGWSVEGVEANRTGAVAERGRPKEAAR
ncbi:MAG TPA: Rrf2 family transcriptional regulator [Pseudonocardia sp.]|nr:Rrf2 family transcriptional regulator [Pseudonocardia sp.]